MTKSWSPKLGGEGAPAYIAILDSLRSDIASGQLLPGDRLPTHRRLAELLGVAVGTITRAYREAERQGATSASDVDWSRLLDSPGQESDLSINDIEIDVP